MPGVHPVCCTLLPPPPSSERGAVRRGAFDAACAATGRTPPVSSERVQTHHLKSSQNKQNVQDEITDLKQIDFVPKQAKTKCSRPRRCNQTGIHSVWFHGLMVIRLIKKENQIDL
ncbi:uncharacterized protein [Atheta coriaria]|uniref:uncharacterized protein n=1 Tax=Dalotia coriaria TaxID=877792 RepID=UPI0031F38C61